MTPPGTTPAALAGTLAAALLVASAARAADVAYVASLVGAADMELGQSKGELSFLDLLAEGALVRIEGGSELRVCHHQSGLVTSVAGPSVVRVAARDLVAESGAAPVRSDERCSAPVISRVQGGSAFRSVGPAGTVAVSPRSWVRVVSTGKSSIRRSTLLAPDERSTIAEFSTVSVSPLFLSSGQTYPLRIELSDGRTVVVKLTPSNAVRSEVAMISVTP